MRAAAQLYVNKATLRSWKPGRKVIVHVRVRREYIGCEHARDDDVRVSFLLLVTLNGEISPVVVCKHCARDLKRLEITLVI